MVRGFSKYTRITMQRLFGVLVNGRFQATARTRARPLVSWIEHGPTTTSRRWSSPRRMFAICFAGLMDGRRCLFRGGQLFLQKDRRQNDFRPLDA